MIILAVNFVSNAECLIGSIFQRPPHVSVHVRILIERNASFMRIHEIKVFQGSVGDESQTEKVLMEMGYKVGDNLGRGRAP